MNYGIDLRFADLLRSRFQKFTSKKSGLYNFRCPYCGDSDKYKNKARGYLFLKKNDLVYKCHNCGVGRSFGGFLKDQAPDLHDEYVMERYKNGLTGKGRNVADPDFKTKAPVFVSTPTGLKKISDLNNSHPAKRYLQDRKIPEDAMQRLYYVDRFQTWVNTQQKTFPDTKNDHARIIIPLIDADGKWFGFQGRSLNPKDKLRYITILLDDEKPKLFGLDKVKKDETIYVTEGPLDSLFIRNSIAMCGADVHIDNRTYNDTVWIYDNEPRNQQIVSRVSRSIEDGQKVVIWPSAIKEKDINDMFLAGHDVQKVIESNVYQGLEAKVKFIEWKKV